MWIGIEILYWLHIATEQRRASVTFPFVAWGSATWVKPVVFRTMIS